MKEPDWKTADEEVIWKYVAWHLAESGINTVLVGGAVCAIYSEGAYQSGDLDFVSISIMDHKIPEILESIGFKRKPGRHYEHPESRFFIEFSLVLQELVMTLISNQAIERLKVISSTYILLPIVLGTGLPRTFTLKPASVLIKPY